MLVKITAALALLLAAAVHAQDYPSRPVVITVPNPPGGMNQIHAQPLSVVIERLTKQPAPVINRAHKGDRLPLIPAKSRNAVNGPVEKAPAPKPRLLDGCEPVVSAIGQSPLAQIPGRCVS